MCVRGCVKVVVFAIDAGRVYQGEQGEQGEPGKIQTMDSPAVSASESLTGYEAGVK